MNTAIYEYSLFVCIQVVAKEMVSRGTGGSIVNISSIAGFRAVPNHTLYCSAKAALDMLSMTLALELGPHKVHYYMIKSFKRFILTTSS